MNSWAISSPHQIHFSRCLIEMDKRVIRVTATLTGKAPNIRLLVKKRFPAHKRFSLESRQYFIGRSRDSLKKHFSNLESISRYFCQRKIVPKGNQFILQGTSVEPSSSLDIEAAVTQRDLLQTTPHEAPGSF